MDLVDVTHDSHQTEIRLAGRLGVGDAAEARRRLDSALGHGRPIVLDAAGVTGIDSAGLQLLAAFCLAAEARGLHPRWTKISPALREGAVLLGLETLLHFGGAGDVHG